VFCGQESPVLTLLLESMGKTLRQPIKINLKNLEAYCPFVRLGHIPILSISHI
jgi:hypothetical protein